MKIAVWDTYVTRVDGKIMHFDILVSNEIKNDDRIYEYGNTYLKSKPFETGSLTSKECQFCHIEDATDSIKKQIQFQGYYIIEMENCQ